MGYLNPTINHIIKTKVGNKNNVIIDLIAGNPLAIMRELAKINSKKKDVTKHLLLGSLAQHL